MSIKTHIAKVAGVGALLTALSIGGAFAAVATSTVNLRDEPRGDVIGMLRAGQHVSITDHVGSWCEISKPGRDGWVKCAVLAEVRYNGGDRFNRYDRFRGDDRYDGYPNDNGPSMSLHFGTNGAGFGFNSGY
jgi:uncharacterized protein YraI